MLVFVSLSEIPLLEEPAVVERERQADLEIFLLNQPHSGFAHHTVIYENIQIRYAHGLRIHFSHRQYGAER